MTHGMMLLGLSFGPAAWAALAAMVLLFGANAVVVYLVVRLPETYFCDPPSRSKLRERHKILYGVLRIAKNALGCLMIVVGALLTLPGIPGPGLVLILLGVTLVEFSAKRRLARNLVRRKAVHGTMNWLRARFGKPPLIIPPRPVGRRAARRASPGREASKPLHPHEEGHA